MQLSALESLSTRLDAEHYRPIFIETENALKQNEWDYLENLTKSIMSFGAYALNNQIEYRESGIPFLRATDIKEGYIDFSNALRIDSAANELLWKSEIKPETVLLTMSGTVGNSSVTQEGMNYPINSSQDVAKIITTSQLNPYYLSVFLQSHYGRIQTSRLPIGSVQQHIFLWQINKLVIPLLGKAFQSSTEHTYREALSLLKQADVAYEEAQTLLLSELGLADWQPKPQTESVRDFSDVWSAGRMDAEYYQPKYDDIVNAIKGYPGGWHALGNLVTMRKCVEVGSKEYLDEGIPFVRVSNITPFEITEEKYISAELYSQVAQHQPNQGEILLSKDATPGIAHYIDEQPRRMIPSGGILRLKRKSDKVNDEYLTLALNSMPTLEQVNRDVGGSVILHWRPDQVAGTLIPILPQAKQAEIQRKVMESATLRRQSRALLERAKRAVEIAIEDGEAAAMEWMSEYQQTHL
ncbi:MAG: hypothetical protein F4X34_05185 [Chloroflexi bacterium]|nr:hypothetical protein [Chloroflexota bacterium]